MNIKLRPMTPSDRASIAAILRNTLEFKPAEVAVAEEVIDSYLHAPADSGYYILVAEVNSAVMGYICYGPTPMTDGTWDLYWIAVAREKQGLGIGSALTDFAEKEIKKARGRLIIVETSSTPAYERTRRYYRSHSYEVIACIPDFYEPGDDKVLLQKRLGMKKPQRNYAFIDGTNLHLTMVYLGWNLDYKRFRVYLTEHYGIAKAYYFVGCISEYQSLYDFLESAGYTMKYKEVQNTKKGEAKGNIDPELVLQAMIDIGEYDKAVLVSSDGDFACLVNHLREIGKLECVLAPCRKGCSYLLKKAARERLYFVENLRQKLEYKKRKRTS